MGSTLKQLQIDLNTFQKWDDETYYDQINQTIEIVQQSLEQRLSKTNTDDENSISVLEDVIYNLKSAISRLDDLQSYDSYGNKLK